MFNAECLIFFEGQIPTLSYFSEALMKHAKEAGMTCIMLDAGGASEENRQTITDCAREKQTVVIMFNNVMAEHIPLLKKSDGFSLTVINILVDHPINYTGTLLSFQPEDYHVIVVDRDHVRFIKTYFPDIRSVHFMPLGGIEEEDPLPYNERDIDILYVGFCQEEPAFIEIPGFADQGRPFYESVCRDLIDHPALTTEAAMKKWLDQNGMRLSDREFLGLYYQYGFRCELMIRRHHKQAIMKGLSESGLRVEVYGGGWENPSSAFGDNIRFHEPVSPHVCGVLTGRAKICLNIMPWFKEGSHDRIHTAMLNGAVAVTDTSAWLSGRFRDGEDIIFYDMKNVPELVDKLRHLLEDADRAEAITKTAYAVAKEHDTWEQRLKFLLSVPEKDNMEETISGNRKVSVIIPCHNVSRTVLRTWDSLKAQTIGLAALECIFVDDASDDAGATWEALQAIEKEAPESVMILQLPENRCLGGARNAALTYASGEFVQFLDADDTLREDACEALYQKARETGADLIQFRHLFVRDDDSGLPMPSGKPPQEDLLFDLRDDAIRRQFLTGSHCTLGCTNKFYRMELLRKTGNHFPEHRIYEEPLFVYPLFLYADTILTIGEEYYHYFWHAGSIMTSKLGKRLLDHPCVQLELLEDLMARKELFERYRREIEVQFLFSFFCETIWFAKKNAGVLPIDFFHQMQQICRSVFPDWASNRTLCGMEAAGKVLPMLSMETETEEELNRRIAEL